MNRSSNPKNGKSTGSSIVRRARRSALASCGAAFVIGATLLQAACGDADSGSSTTGGAESGGARNSGGASTAGSAGFGGASHAGGASSSGGLASGSGGLTSGGAGTSGGGRTMGGASNGGRNGGGGRPAGGRANGGRSGGGADAGGSHEVGGADDAGAAGLGGISGSTGDAGAAGMGGAGDSGGASPGVTMAEVQAVFDDRCIICHDAEKLGLPAYRDLPLTANASWAALVNQPADETCGGTLVVPGHPEQSYLVQKLTSDTPCEGERMPARYEQSPLVPLDPNQIETIRAWISEGAPP